MHNDLEVDRFELIVQPGYKRLAKQVSEDIVRVSPSTQVRLHEVSMERPWDFQLVYEEVPWALRADVEAGSRGGVTVEEIQLFEPIFARWASVE